MVRFSDLLGGSGDPDDARPTTLPNLVEPIPEPVETEPAADELADAATEAAEVEIDAEREQAEIDAESASPEEVLDRLTQYATSTRTGDQVVAAPEPEAPIEPDPVDEQTTDDFLPVGDDLLPRSKAPTRRSRKRRP